MTRVAIVRLRDNSVRTWENAEIINMQHGTVAIQWHAVAGDDAPHYVLIPLDTIKSVSLDPMP